MFRRTHGWFVGGGQLWVPQSAQNKTTNPKEKGFKLKEYSRLKSHESLSESDSKTGHHVREGLAAYRRGRLGITLPAHYDSVTVMPLPDYMRRRVPSSRT
jgi:hypothetical protein